MRKLRLDVSPLRHSRDFRSLFGASIISMVGMMVAYVAVPFQIKELTESYLAVGLVGLAQLGPMIIFGLWGGALADDLDRRTVALRCQVLQVLILAAMTVNALLPSPSLVAIYVLAAATAGASALQRPSLTAIVPRVVAHDDLLAASALTGGGATLAQIAGPAVGGLLVVSVGVQASFAVNALCFAIAAFLLFRLAAVPPLEKNSQPRLKMIMEGFRFAAGRKDILGTYAVDWMAMAFAFPVALFPFVATTFEAEWALGWLYSAGAVGGLLATLTSGWTARVRHQGRAVLISAVIWCGFIAAFGLSTNIWLALLLLAFAGAADTVSGMFRITIWNQSVPDEVRGRLGGLEMLSFITGPQVGQVRSSLVAEWTSIRFSLVSGGLLGIVACVAVAACLPALWRYETPTGASELDRAT